MSSSEIVHLVATITVQDGKIQQAIETLKGLAAEVQKSEPDVLRYFCFRTKNEKGQDQLVMIEKYTSEEAHKAHTTSAHFQAFQKEAKDLLAGPLDIKSGHFVAGYEGRSNL
ncbi:antibiotic biosynthesis monooxygenase, putative [Talaromyces stipitatus ATCC 10500]|uniref:Antibiotic biosynthesis monooxygenase, putative n=1 Tax=Talaromyces stipitatus (strain ATCC 10500 / CBS 375.48 / QM 6759 / NRRL 1006) TaxID=441959 RepID=B8LSW4_TALSN|nr:antibiotic biosynthesis monooxygenase, putative [Talaromyces stipitatus ATCC 10500]EED22960.1 antibiotic biosynthesis monooxygenase, putative [Talaromyces stipitatus ATCC 10500]